MKKKTTEEFIKEAIARHGDKYDYSKVAYTNQNTKINIKCIICDKYFLQTPKEHLKSIYPCKICCINHKKLLLKDDINSFIEKAILKHEDKYDYSNSKYIKSDIPIEIRCKIEEHGMFKQPPSSHLQGHGCPKCSKNKKQNFEEFIKKAKNIHKDINNEPLYEYPQQEYKNAKTKINIICKKCNDSFLQIPDSHIRGNGCMNCAISYRASLKKYDTEKFISLSKVKHINIDKLPIYDYSKVKYVSSITPVEIICKKHGSYFQTPSQHLSGSGCDKCGILNTSNLRRKPLNNFIKESNIIHNNKYLYNKTEYINYKSKLIITCNKHGDFKQTPNEHLHGSGCPYCINKTEGILYEKLQPIYPTIITQFKQEWCKKTTFLPFDFCIPENKIIIELDGPQHFKQISNWSSPEEQLENDKYKEKCANENGYSIIRIIQEDVFDNNYNWLEELCNSIEEIKTNNIVHNIYLCKNNEYNLHQNK